MPPHPLNSSATSTHARATTALGLTPPRMSLPLGAIIAEGQGDEDRGRLWTGLWGYQVNSEDAIKAHGPKVK